VRVACRGFDRRSPSCPWGPFLIGWKMRGRAVASVCQKCIPFADYSGVIALELHGPLSIGKNIVIPSTFHEIYVYGTPWKGIHAPVWLRAKLLLFLLGESSFPLAFRARVWLIAFILKQKSLLRKRCRNFSLHLCFAKICLAAKYAWNFARIKDRWRWWLHSGGCGVSVLHGIRSKNERDAFKGGRQLCENIYHAYYHLRGFTSYFMVLVVHCFAILFQFI